MMERKTMSTEEYVARTIDAGRSWWGITMSLLIVYILFAGSWWWFLPFAAVAYISYYVMLFFVFAWLHATITMPIDVQEQVEAANELNRRMEAGETEGQEIEDLRRRARIEDGCATTTSDTVIGRYMDHDIYEWIDVTTEDGTHRYVFDSVAGKDEDGNPLVPVDGVPYAHLFGVNYKRSPT